MNDDKNLSLLGDIFKGYKGKSHDEVIDLLIDLRSHSFSHMLRV